MKLLVCTLVAAIGLLAAPVIPAAEQAVRTAEKSLIDSMIKRDSATLSKLLADDLVYTHSSALTESKADVLKVISSNSTTYEAIDLSDSKHRQYGDVVIVNHKAKITTKQNGVANLFLTHIWVKNNAGWQLVSRQASRFPAK